MCFFQDNDIPRNLSCARLRMVGSGAHHLLPFDFWTAAVHCRFGSFNAQKRRTDSDSDSDSDSDLDFRVCASYGMLLEYFAILQSI